MTAIIFLAPGFEEIEAISVIDILRRSEIKTQIVGISNLYITGAHEITVKCDIEDKNFKLPSDTKIIILPGGMPGTLNLENSNIIKQTIDIALQKDIFIASICAAPMIIGKLNLLNLKKAVCYPGFEKYLLGAKISDEDVCIDGKFITAKGPGVAIKFALKIVEILKNPIFANNIKKDLLS